MSHTRPQLRFFVDTPHKSNRDWIQREINKDFAEFECIHVAEYQFAELVIVDRADNAVWMLNDGRRVILLAWYCGVPSGYGRDCLIALTNTHMDIKEVQRAAVSLFPEKRMSGAEPVQEAA